MKTGFLKHGSIVSPSTRIRVDFIAKYIENAIASNNTDDLKDCDAVIFQKRYKTGDVEFARELKKAGKIVIFDLTDPVWHKDYPGVYFPVTNDSKEDFEAIIGLADLLIFCTDRLCEMFLETYPGFSNTRVIADSIDLELHDRIKRHTVKDKYIILWHGSKFNIPLINIARDDLEKLYKKIDFDFVIVHEHGGKEIEPFSFKTEYKIWDITTINDEILKADITINPHPENSYKSNNKTVKSWALGIPCVEGNFYTKSKELLSDTRYRQKTAENGLDIAEQYYDSRIIAKQLENLINNIG